MPPIFRFYIRQVLIGFGLAAVLVAALLALNTGNLWHLVTHSDIGVLAVFLLWFFNGIVLAGAQASVAILLMSEDRKPPRGRRMPAFGLVRSTVPVDPRSRP